MDVTPAAKLAPKLAEKIAAATPPVAPSARPSLRRSAVSHSSELDATPKPATDRVFGYVMTAFFSLLGVAPFLHRQPVRTWSLALAATFLLTTWVYAPLLAPLNRAWTTLGIMMHRVMTPFALGLIFFGIVTPAALVMRLFKRDALGLRLDPDAVTYWNIRDSKSSPTRESMKQQF